MGELYNEQKHKAKVKEGLLAAAQSLDNNCPAVYFGPSTIAKQYNHEKAEDLPFLPHELAGGLLEEIAQEGSIEVIDVGEAKGLIFSHRFMLRKKYRAKQEPQDP